MQITSRIFWLRLTGYVGVSLNSMLVPLLIYTLTRSTLFAGVSLCVEWIPKLGLYVFGGALLSGWSNHRAHLGLEVLRLLAFGGMALAACHVLPWWMVSISAAVFQGTSALSNILFENVVSQWWPECSKAEGHARLLNADMLAGFLATGLGLLTNSVLLMLMLGMMSQLLAAILVWTWRNQVHVTQEHCRVEIQKVCRMTLKALGHLNAGLLKVSLIALALSLPSAALISTFPFVLAQAFPGHSMGAREIALGALVRTLTTLLVMQGVRATIKRRPGAEGCFARLSVVCVCFATLLFVFGPGGLALVGLFATGWAGMLALPWTRTARQALLPADFQIRYSLTGLLASIEALAYLVGAACIAASGGNLKLLARLSLVPVCLVIAGALIVGVFSLQTPRLERP